MPSVRIISYAGEASRALADELRGRGFEVQTCAPGSPSFSAADVEIHLNDCPVHEALQRADSVAEIAKQNAEASAKQAVIMQEPSIPSDWPIWQPQDAAPTANVENDTVVAEPADTLSPEVIAAPEGHRSFLRARIPFNDTWFLRISTVAAGAALCGLLLVVMLHRFSPLGNKVSADSTATTLQRAPFQKVDYPTGDTPELQSFQPGPVVDSTPESSIVRAPRSHHARMRHRRTLSRRQDDHLVAPDTVVRYAGSSRSAAAPASHQDASGIRYYTDLKP